LVATPGLAVLTAYIIPAIADKKLDLELTFLTESEVAQDWGAK